MSGKPRLRSIPDPILNEFIYTILYNAKFSEKRGLPGKYLKASMTERAAKTFIKNSSDEDKKIILSHFGYKHFWVFMREDFKQDELVGMLEKYEKNNKAAFLKDIVNTGIIVTSDKDFVRLLGYMSMTIHHPRFFYDLSLQRVGDHIKKWKKRFVNPVDMEMREIADTANEFAKIMLSGLITTDYVENIFGITQQQMKILLYLYTQHHTYVSEEFLEEMFEGYMKRPLIARSVRLLMKEEMIDAERLDGVKRYTINSKGIKVVSEYFKTIFSKYKF